MSIRMLVSRLEQTRKRDQKRSLYIPGRRRTGFCSCSQFPMRKHIWIAETRLSCIRETTQSPPYHLSSALRLFGPCQALLLAPQSRCASRGHLGGIAGDWWRRPGRGNRGYTPSCRTRVELYSLGAGARHALHHLQKRPVCPAAPRPPPPPPTPSAPFPQHV